MTIPRPHARLPQALLNAARRLVDEDRLARRTDLWLSATAADRTVFRPISGR